MRRASLVASVLVAGAVLAAQEPVQIRDVELTVSEGTGLTIALSPNHRWLALNLLGGLWILPADGGTARRITPESIETGIATWAPDSESLAFEGYEDGPWHIYTTRRDGTELRALTSGAYDDLQPAWSHDGRRIAFSSDRFGGIHTIWTVQVQDGVLVRLTNDESATPTWTPLDTEITFSSNRASATPGRRELALRSIDASGRERKITDTSSSGVPIYPSWSPDGRHLAYELNGEVRIDGRASSSDDDAVSQRVQWLTDFEFLYSADGHVKRRSLDGRESFVPFSASLTLKRPTYAAAHRVLEPVDSQPLRGIVSPTVSPNGKLIAFTAAGDVWLSPVDGSPARLTNDAAIKRDPAWSPDSGRLAFASERDGGMDLWVHDLLSGGEALVARERGDVSGPAWSPDGTRIAFLVDGSRLKVVRVAGAERANDRDTIVPVLSSLGRPTWSPDNRSLALSTLVSFSLGGDGLNQILVHAFDPPADHVVSVFAERSAFNRRNSGPVWSPDGSRLAFAANGQLWTIDTDERGAQTTRPQAIAGDHPDSPSWEGDSQHVVFQTPNGLRRVAAGGGSVEPLPIALTWAPSPPPEHVTVHARHIFTGLFDGLAGESDIIIEHGVIAAIESHDDARHVGLVVDAGDDTVMPGLIEMNASPLIATSSATARRLLEAGVTSARVAAVDPYVGLEQREALDNGRRPGPRILMAGDPIDGQRVRDAGGVSVVSVAELDEALERATLLGADFIATRTRLGRRLHQRLTTYAHEHGLRASTSELTAALFFGYDTLAQSPRRPYRDVIDAVGMSGLAVLSTIGAPAKDARFDRLVAQRVNGLKAIRSAGGHIVIGSVLASGNTQVSSLHDEVEQLARGGFSSFEAWRAATADAAAALGVDDVLGTIEPGKLADFAFVTGNPLDDPRTARSVRRVMRGGRLYELTR
jgi:Tol biopolymer transport system component/imidazolonepropionase-like amidohydrolase